MNINSKLLQKVMYVGPGGWNCPCCGPKPSEKQLYTRIARRRLRRYLDKVAKKAY